MRPTLLRLALAAGLCLSAAAPALAQASGFTPGELIFHSQAIPNLSTGGGGILRIDPATGATSVLLELVFAHGRPECIAYDPFRQRLIVYAGIGTFTDPMRVYLLDGFGNTTSLGLDGVGVHGFAPASGGRIYFKPESDLSIRYFDAADQVHFLMDATGQQPFTGFSANIEGLLYHPGTNSLFLAVRRNSPWNCGTTSVNSQILRLPLSNDGSRVLGAWVCADLVVDPTVGSAPVGLAPMPGGQLLAVVSTGSNSSSPRMQWVDPLALATGPFAWNGGLGSVATNAGTWSSVLGRAVVYDSWVNALRAFAQGETGAGTLITPSMPIGGAGSGEPVTLLEIPPSDCGETVGLYCTAKTTSGGCVPALSTAGSPSASAGAGFVIGAHDVEPGNLGIFFYGHAGPASVPFQGGFLCVAPPTWRTAPQPSGGAGPCSGAYAFDFNAYVGASGNAQLVPGAVIHGQFWFRDPPEPTSGTGLSAGVTFTLCP